MASVIGSNKSSSHYDVLSFKTDLNSLLSEEDSYWKQWAKSFWLQNSDYNSHFSHDMASKRCRRNKIHELTCDDGSRVSNQDDIHRVIKNYFN